MLRFAAFSATILANIPAAAHDVDATTAFCQQPAHRDAAFPVVPVPTDAWTPWLFDATLHEDLGVVELTALAPPKHACDVHTDNNNTDLWVDTAEVHALRAAARATIYGAHGVPEARRRNAMADVEETLLMLGERLLCEFQGRDGAVVHTSTSDPVGGDPRWLFAGTVQILCPAAPPAAAPFATVRLRRDLAPLLAVLHKYGVPVPAPLRRAGTPTTAAVPTCSHASLKQQHHHALSRGTVANKQKTYEFDVAVCAAVTTSKPGLSREHLVEWVEYHRLVGVEHFVLYDVTAPGAAAAAAAAAGSLREMVADYVAEGIVSVVPWPYHDCATRTATASCYSRHRRMARFVLATTVDDFVTLSESTWDYYAEDGGTDRDGTDATKRAAQRRRLLRSLFNFARFVLHANKEMPALRFHPVVKYPCPAVTPGAADLPPRVGRWPASVPGDADSGGVLLVRTDVVQMVVDTHVSQLVEPSRRVHRDGRRGEGQGRDRDSVRVGFDPLDVGVDDAAVLRYPRPAGNTTTSSNGGDVVPPVSSLPPGVRAACDALRTTPTPHTTSGSVAGTGRGRGEASAAVLELPRVVQSQLERNYRQRLRRTDELR